MADAKFFTNSGPFTLGEIAKVSGASLAEGQDASRLMQDVAPLHSATTGQLSFFDNHKYLDQFKTSHAGACFVKERFIQQAPEAMALLISDDPYRAYAKAAQLFYPTKLPVAGIHSSAVIADSALIANGVYIGAGVCIGEHVTIGENSVIYPNSVIYDGVTIGKNSVVGALSSISHTIIGNNVIIHRGVHIGQDGFGYALGRNGHEKVPQLGRVIIEDYVEIGSGTTIDRGTGPDTVIAQGAKIDNLVQIGHNVKIGAGAVVIAQAGISGSTTIGAGTILAGQSGLAGHLTIGNGVKIAAKSGVMDNIPDGASYGGSPAMPVRDWHRQTLYLREAIGHKRGKND